MKIISWNVNGIRACIAKGFSDFVNEQNADIICIQEAKMQEGQADISMAGYKMFLNSAEKKGYSGTICYTKLEPKNVIFGIDGKHTNEGRVITLEFENFYLVNSYVPNAQDELKRIDYREEFEDDMREYLIKLKKQKPVVYTGDMNCARNELDIKIENKSAKAMENLENSAGYSNQERAKMEKLLSSGFVDTFRTLYPEKQEYSWWSYKFRARERNAGWRIDYFIVSDDILSKVKDSEILTDVFGSDHAPIKLTIDL